MLFGDWHRDIDRMFQNLRALILELKHFYTTAEEQYALLLEQLFRLNTLLNTFEELNNRFGNVLSPSNFSEFFRDILRNETLDFEGEPLQGLQVMGMLESRLLDFETVIITSVNEGHLAIWKIAKLIYSI